MIKAIIFDLFGTLIDNFSISEYKEILSKMATILGAPSEQFINLWTNSFDKRMI